MMETENSSSLPKKDETSGVDQIVADAKTPWGLTMAFVGLFVLCLIYGFLA